MKVLLFTLFLCVNCFSADGFLAGLAEQQQAKAKRQWSLLDWMVTKKKIKLQDQFLALHSSDDYFEFYAQGAAGDAEHKLNEVVESTEHTITSQAYGMYVRFLGLEYKKNKISQEIEDESYQASLMLIGSSIQSTSLGGFGGARKIWYSAHQKFEQPFYGGWLQLYLLPFIGIRGQHTVFSEEAAKQRATDIMKGTRDEVTGFIELGVVRLQATLFKEVFEITEAAIPSEKEVEGLIFGGSLFF